MEQVDGKASVKSMGAAPDERCILLCTHSKKCIDLESSDQRESALHCPRLYLQLNETSCTRTLSLSSKRSVCPKPLITVVKNHQHHQQIPRHLTNNSSSTSLPHPPSHSNSNQFQSVAPPDKTFHLHTTHSAKHINIRARHFLKSTSHQSI